MEDIHHIPSPALARITQDLLNVIQSGSHWERVAAAGAVGRLRWHAQKAIPVLIELADRDPDATTVVVDAIGQIGPPGSEAAIPFLSRILLDEAETRHDAAPLAAHALGRTRSSRAAMPLLEAVARMPADSDTAIASVNALGNLGGNARDALPSLAERLDLSNPSLATYLDAVSRIGVASPEVVDRLRRVLAQLAQDHELRPALQELILKAEEQCG